MHNLWCNNNFVAPLVFWLTGLSLAMSTRDHSVFIGNWFCHCHDMNKKQYLGHLFTTHNYYFSWPAVLGFKVLTLGTVICLDFIWSSVGNTSWIVKVHYSPFLSWFGLYQLWLVAEQAEQLITEPLCLKQLPAATTHDARKMKQLNNEQKLTIKLHRRAANSGDNCA